MKDKDFYGYFGIMMLILGIMGLIGGIFKFLMVLSFYMHISIIFLLVMGFAFIWESWRKT